LSSNLRGIWTFLDSLHRRGKDISSTCPPWHSWNDSAVLTSKGSAYLPDIPNV